MLPRFLLRMASADSDVPTEATASAATTAWTGFRCVGNWGNCEEYDRRRAAVLEFFRGELRLLTGSKLCFDHAMQYAKSVR